MSNRRRMLGALAALATTAAMLMGCEGSTRMGTPYTQKFGRELVAYLDGHVSHVHAVARRVLEGEMGYTVYEDALDISEGVLRAETARGRVVKVESFANGETVTRIEVWASPAGDESRARDVLSRIEDAL